MKKLIVALNGMFLLAGMLVVGSFFAGTASAAVNSRQHDNKTMMGQTHHRRHRRHRRHHRRHHKA